MLTGWGFELENGCHFPSTMRLCTIVISSSNLVADSATDSLQEHEEEESARVIIHKNESMGGLSLPME